MEKASGQVGDGVRDIENGVGLLLNLGRSNLLNSGQVEVGVDVFQEGAKRGKILRNTGSNDHNFFNE